MHRTALFLGSLLLAGTAQAQDAPAPGPVVEIRNFVGTIDWSNGPLSAKLVGGDSVRIDRSSGDLAIDGQLNPKRYKCKTRRTEPRIRTTGRKYRPVSDYPVLRLQIPEGTQLDIDDSVVFAVDPVRTGRLDLDIGHCSRVVLGDTSGLASLDIAGASDVTIGNSARLILEASGASEVRLGGTGPLSLDVSGATEVELGRVTGVAQIEASGASDVKIEALTARNLRVDASGASEVQIADGRVDGLKLDASGASDIVLKVDAITAELRASGASDVRLRSVSGGVEQSSSGASDIRIGG